MNPRTLGAVILASLAVPGVAAEARFAVSLDLGLRTMSNSRETEKAIFDQQRGFGAGLGVSFERGARWRFGVDARRINRTGERAFAADRTSEAFRLGHPLRLTMTPVLASFTYRFEKLGRISPYLGVGGGLTTWRERSEIASVVEEASGTNALFEARLGLASGQGLVRLAIEGGITWVPGAVGLGGISKVYEESDLGGLFMVLRLGFWRK